MDVTHKTLYGGALYGCHSRNYFSVCTHKYLTITKILQTSQLQRPKKKAMVLRILPATVTATSTVNLKIVLKIRTEAPEPMTLHMFVSMRYSIQSSSRYRLLRLSDACDIIILWSLWSFINLLNCTRWDVYKLVSHHQPWWLDSKRMSYHHYMELYCAMQ